MLGKIIGTVRVAECESRDGRLVKTGRVIDLEAPRECPIFVIVVKITGDEYRIVGFAKEED